MNKITTFKGKVNNSKNKKVVIGMDTMGVFIPINNQYHIGDIYIFSSFGFEITIHELCHAALYFVKKIVMNSKEVKNKKLNEQIGIFEESVAMALENLVKQIKGMI